MIKKKKLRGWNGQNDNNGAVGNRMGRGEEYGRATRRLFREVWGGGCVGKDVSSATQMRRGVVEEGE